MLSLLSSDLLRLKCHSVGCYLAFEWSTRVQGVMGQNKLTPRLLNVFTSTKTSSIEEAIQVGDI